MKKMILTALLLVSFVVCVTPFSAFAAEPEAVSYSGNYDGVDWRITVSGTLILGHEGETQEFVSPDERNLDYPREWQNITAAKFEGKVIGNGSMEGLFSGDDSLKTVDFTGFDTSNVTDMNGMFCGCGALTRIDFTGFDTSNVTDMSYMFFLCGASNLDLTCFDTSNVRDMQCMFNGCCSLSSLDVSSFDTSNVTNMAAMFACGDSLTDFDVSGFDTSNVTDMGSMFKCGSASIDVSGFDTSKVTNMHWMFSECESLTSLDVTNFDTSNVTDMSYMFSGCKSLTSLDLTGFDTSSVTDMGQMFYECNSLTSLDLTSFDTSSVTNMSKMFYGCRSLTSLDLTSFDTSSVTDMSEMFFACGLDRLDLRSFDTQNVTNMKSMLPDCDVLKCGKNFGKAVIYNRFAQFCKDMYDYESEEYHLKGNCIPVGDYHIYVSDLSIDPGDTSIINPGDDPKPPTPEDPEDIDPELLVNRYTIGKDTWNFDNVATGPLKYAYFRKFLNKYQAKVYYLKSRKGFSGTCFGFSMLIPSILENDHPYKASNKQIHDYTYEEVKEWLALGQVYQCCPKAVITEKNNMGKLNKLYEAVTDEMYRQGEPVVIAVGNHEVLATSIDKDTPEEVIIGIYDPDYPDNLEKDDNREFLLYSSIRLYGENGNYDTAVWGASLDKGGELVGSQEVTEVITFENNYLDSFKGMSVDELSDATYGLLSTPKDVDIITLPFPSLDDAILINFKVGEQEESDTNLYLVKSSAGEYNIPGVKAGQTIELALNNKCISITPDKDADILLKMSNDSDGASVTVNSETDNKIQCEYLEDGTGDSVISTDLVFEGAEQGKISIASDKITTSGITSVDVEQVKGSFDEEASIDGQTIFTESVTDIDEGSDYTMNIEAEPQSIDPTIQLSKSTFTYNGKVQKPVVTVKAGNTVLKAGVDYDVTFGGGCKNVGTYNISVVLKGKYRGQGTASYKIVKAANTMKAAGKTVPVKYKKLKKKTQKITVKKAFTVKNPQGKVTYKVKKYDKKAKKKIAVSKAGKVTVKKGLKKGTYKITVNVTAAGTAQYKAVTKPVKLTIKVK